MKKLDKSPTFFVTNRDFTSITYERGLAMIDFEEVYQKYFDTIYRYSYSLCRNEKIAEEVTQDTFLKAIKQIDKYDSAYRFETWLCQIAKNTYFTMFEKNKRWQAFDFEVLEESFEKAWLNKEEAMEIHKNLHKLEEPYKEVFNLRLFGELSFAQIGQIFGKTENWARITFHRGKIKIKERLQ